MFTDNHALIDRRLRVDKHRAAILQIENSKGDCRAGFAGNQGAIATAGNVACLGCLFIEPPIEHTRASRVR